MSCALRRTEKDSKDQPKDKAKENADTDPEGEEMMRVAAPLAEARKYLTTLQTYCADRIATHMAASEVFRRLEKPLLVLQALNRAKNIDESDPEYQIQLTKFADGCKSATMMWPLAKS